MVSVRMMSSKESQGVVKKVEAGDGGKGDR